MTIQNSLCGAAWHQGILRAKFHVLQPHQLQRDRPIQARYWDWGKLPLLIRGLLPKVCGGDVQPEPWNQAWDLCPILDQNLWLSIPLFRTEGKHDTHFRPLKLVKGYKYVCSYVTINVEMASICVNILAYGDCTRIFRAAVKTKLPYRNDAILVFFFAG